MGSDSVTMSVPLFEVLPTMSFRTCGDAEKLVEAVSDVSPGRVANKAMSIRSQLGDQLYRRTVGDVKAIVTDHCSGKGFLQMSFHYFLELIRFIGV